MLSSAYGLLGGEMTVYCYMDHIQQIRKQILQALKQGEEKQEGLQCKLQGLTNWLFKVTETLITTTVCLDQ